jgi:SRSO17 transposase
VPEQVGFATKPELADDMIEAALDAGVVADFAVGDEAYGINPELRQRLQARGLPYVLAVACTTPITVEAGKTTAAAAIDQAGIAWQRRSAGAGAKGLRLYDWAWIDLISESEGHTHLLARRNRRTGELAYYLTWTLTPVPLQTLVTVAGMRWRIEETFQGVKELTGLDEHQVRTWTSWHRWVTLAMLACAFLAVTRARETDPNDQEMISLTCNEIRHLPVSALAPDLDWAHRLRWSAWRRHQATAKRLHYRRQLALAA